AFRYRRESLPPPEYLSLSYYGLWTRTIELMMLEYGIATPEELKAGHAIAPFKKAPRAVRAAVQPARAGAGAVQARRQGARQEHASARAHAAAALCARPRRRGGAHRRLPRLSRQQRRQSRRRPALALYCAFRRTRIVGRGLRPDGARVHRGLGALSGAGVMDQAAARRAADEVASIPRDADG